MDFYQAKSVVKTEWWLDDSQLPQLLWARLRVFDDGTADVCWSECSTLYGFVNQDFAGYFLSEDEYIRFASMDEEDEQKCGIKLASISPPNWLGTTEQEFEYLGQY